MISATNGKPRVALFVTCLVDLFRPSVGFAAVKLLEDAQCEVFVPSQTCCGQPAYNSGDRQLAKEIALYEQPAGNSRLLRDRLTAAGVVPSAATLQVGSDAGRPEGTAADVSG